MLEHVAVLGPGLGVRSLLSTSCAHFVPGRFQALEADTAVTVCAAAASDTVE